MVYFGLKLGQDLGNRAAHPHQEFRGVPPPPPPTTQVPIVVLEKPKNLKRFFSFHTAASAEYHENLACTSAFKQSKLASEGNPSHIQTTIV